MAAIAIFRPWGGVPPSSQGLFLPSYSGKVLHGIGLYRVVIWNVTHLLLSQFAVDMTVSLMIVDTQEMLAVRKLAFPAISRSL